MKIQRTLFHATAAAVMTTAAFSLRSPAQSADALIDKLVEKGVLTLKEGKELRDEADKGFNSANQVKSGMPDWVNSLKFNGDFRGRFERHDSENPAYIDRNRFRYRARFGITASMLDNFEVGFRLASGNPVSGFGGNPLSANTDLSDGGSRKFVWFDAAYAKWTPVNAGSWLVSSTIGKMDNPFTLSPMVFDPDYQPEGAALQTAYTINDKHSLKFNGGFFVLDEFNQGPAASHDPFMAGGQLLWEAKWTRKIESSASLAAFGFGNTDNLLNSAAPNLNDGNTRGALGNPLYNFNPVVGGASLTYKLDGFPFYKDAFPIKFGGEFMHNSAAPSKNSGWWAGVTLGKAGHKGLWEASWKYQRLERDAFYEELTDDDNGAFYQTQVPEAGFAAPGAGYRGGTNVKGHVVRLTYNVTDAMNIAFTYYLSELIDPSPAGSLSASSHWMLDLMWKF